MTDDIIRRVMKIANDDLIPERWQQEIMFPDSARTNDSLLWTLILGKRIGKVSSLVLDLGHAVPHSPHHMRLLSSLRYRLVQVAAVALAWWDATDPKPLSLDQAIQHGATYVGLERIKQHEKFGVDGTCASHTMSDVHKFAVLAEEFGEAAADVNELWHKDHDGIYKGAATLETLRKELIQVAAVAVAWIESMDYKP